MALVLAKSRGEAIEIGHVEEVIKYVAPRVATNMNARHRVSVPHSNSFSEFEHINATPGDLGMSSVAPTPAVFQDVDTPRSAYPYDYGPRGYGLDMRSPSDYQHGMFS